jgi:hypothetical protein
MGALLGAVLAVTVAASCGGSSHTTSTAGSQSATAPAAGATGATGAVTSSAGGKTSGARPPHTDGASTGAASTSAQATSPSPGERLLRQFAGEGNGRLGTIVVRAQTRLVWNTQHPGVQIFTSNEFMLVNSRSTSGAVRLSRGTYRGVRVSAAGRWSVELRSASS